MVVHRSSIAKSIMSAFAAAFIGGAFSCVLFIVRYPDAWRLSRNSLLLFLTLHVFLMALLLASFSKLEINLGSVNGILKSVAVGIVGSMLVILLGLYPSFGLWPNFALFVTGAAFTTSFVAVFAFVLIFRAVSRRER